MLGSALGSLMRTEPRIAIALLARFNTATQKVQAARKIAEQTLCGDELEKFSNTMKEFELLAKERNNIIHGLWGTSDAEPDTLLWMRPEDNIEFDINFMSKFLAGEINETGGYHPPQMEIYDLARFEGVEGRIELLKIELGTLKTKLSMDAMLTKIKSGDVSPDVQVTIEAN